LYTTKVTFHQVFWRIVTLFRVIEIGLVIWDLDQIPARGIEQIKEWYAEFPVKASAAPRSVWASSAGCAWSAAPLG